MWFNERRFHVYPFEVLTNRLVEPKRVDALGGCGEFCCVDEGTGSRRWGFLTGVARKRFKKQFNMHVLGDDKARHMNGGKHEV